MLRRVVFACETGVDDGWGCAWRSLHSWSDGSMKRMARLEQRVGGMSGTPASSRGRLVLVKIDVIHGLLW